tara:strand:+ start:1125 stop:1388 length:264 start_codon:yes stop_codon:yes gene_type:complete
MIKLADRRLITNISTVGTSESGINIYRYEFVDCVYGCGLFEGVIADEVSASAVSVNEDGYSMVNYAMIDVEFKQIEDYSLYEGRGEV